MTPNLRVRKKRHTFIPRVAAVQLTETARTLFQQLLQNPIRSDIIGILLRYEQSQSGEPRMVYSFTFVTNNDIDLDQDEAVSLELIPQQQQQQQQSKSNSKSSNEPNHPAAASTTTVVLTDQTSTSGDETTTTTTPALDNNVTITNSNTATTMVPKPPSESRNDGLPKLYIHHNAFLKVLGATIDVDTKTMTPILYDREGNRMDPNA
jgi:hypothetical protein